VAQSKPLRAIAIDPGERTGWAVGTVPPDEPPRLLIESQGVNTIKTFAKTLGEKIGDYDVVIYETWRLRPDMARKMVGNDFQPSQLIGIIRYLCWIHPDVKIVSQGPNVKATGEKVMPEYIRERFARSSEQHDKDALMHLSHWFWKAYTIPYLKARSDGK
jgi:hypothetical protein